MTDDRRTYQTPAHIKALKRPPTGQIEYFDAIAGKLDSPAPGLAVRVSSRGTKSFTLAYRFNDKSRGNRVTRRDTIGRFSEAHPPHEGIATWGPRCPLSLKEARSVAAHMLRLAESGIDPREEHKKAEAKAERVEANTYKKAVETYVTRWHEQREKNKSADHTKARLLRAAPEWHELPVASITQEQIQDALDAVLDRGHHYEANRRWTALRHFFRWLTKRRIIDADPTANIDKPSSGEASRERHWSDAELKAIWKAADGLDPTRAAWLRIMVLTGARPNEVAGMRRKEIDLDAGVWVVPPERHKTGKKTKAPNFYELPPLAVRVLKGALKAAKPETEFVFPGRGNRDGDANSITLNSRLRKRIRELSEVGDYYDYAARHTFATGLKELKVPPHIISACMNHRPHGTTAIYMHGSYRDEMGQACEDWAKHIEKLVYPEGVVGLRG